MVRPSTREALEEDCVETHICVSASKSGKQARIAMPTGTFLPAETQICVSTNFHAIFR